MRCIFLASLIRQQQIERSGTEHRRHCNVKHMQRESETASLSFKTSVNMLHQIIQKASQRANRGRKGKMEEHGYLIGGRAIGKI